MFLCKQNICSFIKQAIGLCLRKLGQKHASKDGIELAVFVAFGEVLSFGLGVAERVLVHLLTVLLIDGLTFVHSVVYNAHKQAHNQYRKQRSIVELESGTHKIWGME